jgi:hypothetical protein
MHNDNHNNDDDDDNNNNNNNIFPVYRRTKGLNLTQHFVESSPEPRQAAVLGVGGVLNMLVYIFLLY